LEVDLVPLQYPAVDFPSASHSPSVERNYSLVSQILATVDFWPVAVAMATCDQTVRDVIHTYLPRKTSSGKALPEEGYLVQDGQILDHEGMVVCHSEQEAYSKNRPVFEKLTGGYGHVFDHLQEGVLSHHVVGRRPERESIRLVE
jgi:hypothetical protein